MSPAERAQALAKAEGEGVDIQALRELAALRSKINLIYAERRVTLVAAALNGLLASNEMSEGTAREIAERAVACADAALTELAAVLP